MTRIVQILYVFFVYSFVCGFTVLWTMKADKAHNKVYAYIYSILAVFTPAMFAGLRSLNVGTDVMIYAYQTFQKASAATNLIEFLNVSSLELGYSALAYVCSHIGGNVHTFLGATALLQIIPIYVCAIKLKNKFDMKWPVFVFMMAFYVVGFNIMRQSIAAAWILLAYVLFEEKKYLKMICSCIMAFMFHSVAILGTLFLVLAFLLNKIKSKKKLIFACVCFFIAFIFLMRYWPIMIGLMGQYGFLAKDKVIGYSNIFGNSNSTSYFYTITIAQYVEMFFKVLLVIPVFFYRRKSKDKFFNTTFGIYLFGVLIYLYFFLYYGTSYGYRISMFAEYFLILLLPVVLNKNRIEGKKFKVGVVSLNSLVVFLILFLNWLILFVILQTHGTYPFKFFFE